MKVVYLMNGLQMGGGETIAVALLPKLRDRQIDITLLTMNMRRDDPELTATFARSGVPRIDLQAKKLLDPSAFRRLVTILRRERYDVIHASDQDTIVYGALARRFVGSPAIMTRHVLDEPKATARQRVRAKLASLSMRYGYDKVIAVSDAVGRHLEQTYGVRHDCLETVYNGLDVARFNTIAQRDRTREALGWAKDDRVITMVAVLRPGKGHEMLFSVAPELFATDPRIKIKIVGGGPLEGDLKARASILGDRVEFLGQRPDIPEILGASDILVLPSQSEALPTVLMEAGAVGIPVVATDVGGTREIVVDGETGFIVAPGDATAFAERLLRLFHDPALAAEMGHAAQTRIHENFSIDRQADVMADLYRRVSIPQ